MTVFFLDAGHSGVTTYGKYLTPGKRSPQNPPDGIYEGEFNRQLVDEIVKLNAESKNPLVLQPVVGNCVIDIDLKDRLAFVNSEYNSLRKQGIPSVLVSIHANASGNGNDWSDANGFVAFQYPKSKLGSLLATSLIDGMQKRTNLRSRGIKSSRKLYILNGASCPAALLECGFMTNLHDTALLRRRAGRAQLAVAVLHGLKRYKELTNG